MLSITEVDEFIDNDFKPPTDEAARRLRTKTDREAMALIGMYLSDLHLEHVSGVTTALQMWKAVMDIFERHVLLKTLGARRKLYTTTMTKDESVLSLITRVKHLAPPLQFMNSTIDDADISMTVFNLLTDRFENLISALEAPGNEDKMSAIDFVKSRMLQEKQRMKMRTKRAIVKT